MTSVKSTIQPKLSIVFLNYNRLAETRYTLKQLFWLGKQRHDIEIIAVDLKTSWLTLLRF